MNKVLIIDDSKEMANGLAKMLELFNLESEQAYGSRSGLAALNEFIPEVIFLDINMPGVGGFEVLGFINREPRLKNVPVVIVTSDDQPETLERARNEGVKEFIIKPISVETLGSALKKINLLIN